MNRWRVLANASGLSTSSVRPRRRRAPPRGQPPLLSTVRPERTSAVSSRRPAAVEPGHAEKRPDASGVSERKGPELSGVSGRKGPELSGVSPAKGPDVTGVPGVNPAKTPPETPPPNGRAGREPLNPRIGSPPNPPEGGRAQRWVIMEESYVSDRGRRRRRSVHVDLGEVRQGLDVPSADESTAWRHIRYQLQRRVG
jgi:hypothetical protein